MANGNFGGGTGILADPFIVEDAQDLDAIRNNVSAHYSQSEDIDLSSYPNWIPIGNSSSIFSGSYFGNGFTIANLKIDATSDDVGLFGVAYGIQPLKDIAIVNCDISTTGSFVGALMGRGSSGGFGNPKAIRCYSTGKVRGNNYVGGLVGAGYEAYGIAKDCYSTCSVYGSGERVGGFCGTASGGSYSTRVFFDNCYSAGPVTGYSAVGGFCGNLHGHARYCYSLAPYVQRINGSTSTLFGSFTSSTSATLLNCFSLDSMEYRG